MVDLRDAAERLREDLRRRIGTTRSRLALVNRFKLRCEWHDRERMLAEYFGPQSAVCGKLTSEGLKEFKLETATSSCAKAFKANQHVLKHKQPGNDNSGYSKSGWRTVVKQFVSALRVRIHGSKAGVTGPSNLGDATLVKVGGHWLFASEPPPVGP